MPAYLVADETITDPEAFEDYKRAVRPLVVRHGGRFLFRGGELEVLETGRGWTPGRMVIVEFSSMAALKASYDSADSAPVLAIRLRSSNSTLVALDASGAGPAA